MVEISSRLCRYGGLSPGASAPESRFRGRGFGVNYVALARFACLGLLAFLAGCRHVPPAGASGQGAAPPSLKLTLESGQVRGLRLQEKQAGRASVVFVFTNADTILKAEVYPEMDEDSAQILLKDGVMALEALYADALSPYPGDISHHLQASAKFRPKLFLKTESGVTFSCFLLYANDRLGYGATAEDLIRYKSLLAWFHEGRSGPFYKVRLYKPLTAQERLPNELTVDDALWREFLDRIGWPAPGR